jgi:uncharacterized protein (DUF488 family)
MTLPQRSDPEQSVVFTIGHGTRTAQQLTEVLTTAGVECLVDVRRFPVSRRNPQFTREQLERWLPAAGIDYHWRGEELGGRRSRTRGVTRHPAWRNAAFRSFADHTDSGHFRDAIRTLEQDARIKQLTIMCAETLWWRCHRRLIADTLELRGMCVNHLLRPGSMQQHKLHPAVRGDPEGWPVYDLGETSELELRVD